MSLSPKLVIAVVILVVSGVLCIWGKDTLWKWDLEIRQKLGYKTDQRTPQWEREVTLVGVICLVVAVAAVVVFGILL